MNIDHLIETKAETEAREASRKKARDNFRPIMLAHGDVPDAVGGGFGMCRAE